MSTKNINKDNPGGGDCAFYALALGMMDIIQRQSTQNTNSELFESWLQSDTELTGVTLQTIQAFNIAKAVHSQADKNLLLTLQFSLRRIAAEAAKIDLLAKIFEERDRPTERLTLVEGSSIAINFMALVQSYSNEQPLDTKFNDLALDGKVCELAKKTTQAVKQRVNHVNHFNERHRVETTIIKQVILDDVIVNGAANENSVLLKGIDTVKNQGKWGTHDNLKEIAGYLGLNLRVNNQVDGVNDPELPTVTLNNLGNCHWTTVIQTSQNDTTEHFIAASDKKTYASNVAEQLAKQTIPSAAEAKQSKTVTDELHVSATENKTTPKTQSAELIQALIAQRQNIQQRAQAIAKKDTADYSDEELALTLQEEEFLKAGM